MTKEQLESIKTVGVVSVMGNTFYGVEQGTTIFQREDFTADIQNWYLNEFVEDITSNYLNNCSTFKVVKIPYDSQALFSVYAKESYEFDRIQSQISEMAKLHDADVVVLILEKNYVPYGTLENTKGFYFYRRSFLGLEETYLVVISEVGILDARLNDYMARWPFAEDFAPYADTPKGLDELTWKESFELYSEKDKAFIKEIIEKKIQLQVFKSLQDMNLITTEDSSCPVPK